MPTLTRPSPAKINLTLRVAGVRSDGFHELESLVTLIDLADTIHVTPQERGRWRLESTDDALPPDSSNLALRAARLLVEHVGENHGLDIRLDKRIPLGAGLGGGSSNAATTLMLLNELWGVGLTVSQLAHLGTRLGSDVPLFFHGPLALIRGRGEHVEACPQRLDAWVVLLLPELHCSTPDVYAAWDAMQAEAGGATGSGVDGRLRRVLDDLSRPDELMTRLYNDLEEPAFRVQPELRRLAAGATRLAGGPVRVTGSGAAMFRLFSDASAARVFAEAANAELGVRSEICRTQQPASGPY